MSPPPPPPRWSTAGNALYNHSPLRAKSSRQGHPYKTFLISFLCTMFLNKFVVTFLFQKFMLKICRLNYLNSVRNYCDSLNTIKILPFPSLFVTPNFPKETKCTPICMPGSSFMHIVTYKCIQKQYHVRKRKIIRDLRFILETKAPNITDSRPGVAYA
jgi:hypothetical protein